MIVRPQNAVDALLLAQVPLPLAGLDARGPLVARGRPGSLDRALGRTLCMHAFAGVWNRGHEPIGTSDRDSR